MITKAAKPIPAINTVNGVYEKTAGYKDYKKADIKNPELYKFFVEKYGTILTFREFSFIIGEYTSEMVHHILNGERVRLHHRLSYLFIKEFKRTHRLDRNGNYLGAVDWKTTYSLNIRQENGKLKRAYFVNQPFWYKIYWDVGNCILHNKSIYKFEACKHFKVALALKINNNSLIHLSYRKNSHPRGSTQNDKYLSDNF